MTEESAANETQDLTVSEPAVEETAVADTSDDEVIEGEIVGGTWINPSIPADDPRRTQQAAQFSYTLPEGRQSFMRMIFGSVVIFTEEIGDRASVSGEEEDESRQRIQAAINQAVSQDQSVDRRPYSDLRYGTIGFLSSALDKTHGGAGHISGMADSAARAAGKIISPIWNSFLFAPFQEPVHRAEKAGENKVDEWIKRGRVEEVRSRALAEVSINNFVDESVTELAENTQIQMIVQEVIASQSTSIMGEILDEVRERLVSLDLVLMSKLRQEMVAGPDFREAYLQDLFQRYPRYRQSGLAHTLAGTYAGPITRLVAFLLDIVILLIMVGLISSFVSSTLNLFGLTQTVVDFLTTGGTLSTIAVALLAAFNFLLIAAYFILCWNWTGMTVGDGIFGLRVVNKQGGRVTLFRSILRLFGGYVSAAALMLGFIWALFDGRRQGWHDKFGGTFVLYNWPAKPEETFLHDQVEADLQAADLV